eukprot:CAMPEP_0197340922 /NCGR_PEP_ID=MMETSP0892-20130614/45946_1 /TAXON_ID=44058 ORGANISM="Aureoumbra lagunensis, Strain CCMP1510" /NCGR_SAMPLE_ID=MMETSP0892 /ASSEMBLY_ACC=CAM_ASM_000538 /LENGTH=228 /DNA_ID=CAMNT_0042845739 /DNA_START=13 /DNA_END=699 /DNA_ORIENTATION=-
MSFRGKLARASWRGSSSQKQSTISESKLNKEAISELFNKWADETDLMTMEGISSMAEALGMEPSSDVRLLSLCWRLGAKRPGQLDKEEWIEGMEKLGIDSMSKLEALIPNLDPKDLDKRNFRDFFKFVFLFSREGTHRTLEKDIVRVLLPIAICDRSEHTVPFLEFLESSQPDNLRLTLDQWCSFLEFSYKVSSTDFSGYEPDGAWPLLLDDYVDTTKRNMGLSSSSS